MLNALKHFQLVDTHKPNLVIALTHVMSIPKGNFTKKVQEQSECIQEIIRATFGIEGSIVCIENCAESYGLEIDGDWTVLADGTRQPINLFNAMIKLMKKNCDEVGVEAIRLFFPNKKPSKPEERMNLQIEIRNEEKMHRWRRVLNYRTLRIIDNECTMKIRDHQRKNPTIPKNDLLPLMSELNRARISHPNDIRGNNIFEVQILVWPYILTPLDKEILIYLFDVQPAKYRQFLEEIGHGCYTNEIMPTAPEAMFNFTKQEEPLKIRNGVYLPDCMEINFAEDTTVYCYCPTLTKNENQIKDGITDILVSEIEPESVLNEKKQYTFVFMVTHTVFKLTIQFLSELQKCLNPGLKESALALPDDCIVGLTEGGANCHPLYLDFLKKYGHCLLTHWEGGGIVSGQITVEIFHLDIQKTEGIIRNYLRMYFTSSNITKEPYQEELVNYVVKALHAVKLTYKGGSAPLVKDNILGGLNSIKIDEWKRSLLKNPAPLESIQLSKLSIAIYEIIQEKCLQLKQVFDIIAPEYDIDDRLTEMEAEYYLNDSELFEVKQAIEHHPVSPERRSRRSSFLTEYPILSEYYNITLDDILEESTREYASRKAKNNAINTTQYGFPANAKVRRKNDHHLDPEEVEMRYLEVGDLVECVSQNQLRLYLPLLSIFKMLGDFQFIQAEHDNGKIAIGELNNIIKGHRLEKVTAKKLKIGDRLVWAEPKGTKMKTTEIKQLSLVREIGNIQPTFNDSDFIYMIVNEIVCGRQGNASLVFRGGDRIKMDQSKTEDQVLSSNTTTDNSEHIVQVAK